MSHGLRRIILAAMAAGVSTLCAQTTDGFVTGTLRDSVSGNPIPGASIVCESAATNTRVPARSGEDGSFGLPLMPPGNYRVRVEEATHQAVDIQNLVLPVAGVLNLDLRLRPLSDVWERNQYRSVYLPGSRTMAVFYGPDVDTSYSGNFEPPPTSAGRLDTSISDVISPQLIAELPLQGRDVYTALVMEPGVTSDSATSRGIGVAVNGQRPASSNFLLDGSENNNYLVSGPLLTLPPEAIQEFRFSTANFSAEYGGTAGFVVNAVTRSGGSRWHGIGYVDANRAGFNANDFQRNANVEGRLPFYQYDFGLDAGGPAPLRKRWLFVNTALDFLRSKGDTDSETRAFPSPSYIAQMAAANPTSWGVRLLERYPPPAGTLTVSGMYSIATVTPTTTIHRFLGLERFDVEPPNSKHQLSIRLAGGWMNEPDFDWSPYAGFSTALDDRTAGINGDLRSAPSPNLTNDLRASWIYDNLAFPQPHPEVPNLITDDQIVLPTGKALGGGVWLPSAGTLFGYQNRTQTTQIADSVTWVRGRHIFKFGAGALFRSIGGYLGLYQNGELTFSNLTSFFADQPSGLELGIDRLAWQNNQYQSADFNRLYHNRQFDLFAEDSVRASGRISLNFGIRYDNFGVPVNVGAVKDDVVVLGPGPDMPTRIAGANLVPSGGNEKLFAADNRNFAGRFGFSDALDQGGRTVLRGGYGVFYDRSFDNLWQNLALNNVIPEPGCLNNPPACPNAPFSYSLPLVQNLAGMTQGGSNFNRLFMYQPGLRTPYVQSLFLGLQRQLARGVLLESNYAASFGRKLITTDRINRADPLETRDATNGRYNIYLPDIFYRGNQGDANYDAFTVKVSGALRSATFRLAYTWSHSIDNQSEPLEGEFDDLSIINVSQGSSNGVAAFAQQFASGLDRGSSDFDQRHNLVGMGFWELPGFLHGWRVSWLGAIRSGLPFTVYASEDQPIDNSRASLIDPANWRADQPVSPGGVRLLNPAAFGVPAQGTLGNTGRNGFPGPGFFSVDASLSRSFRFKRLPEADRLILRVDLFNMLNHVNLNDPQPVALSSLGSSLGFNPNFGVAYYGRGSIDDGSPVLTPLQETARQIQLILRLEF